MKGGNSRLVIKLQRLTLVANLNLLQQSNINFKNYLEKNNE
jgi:hypothetical protein